MTMLPRIALTFIPGVGMINARTLISYCGGEDKVFDTSKAKLLRIPGIGEKIADAIVHHKDAFLRAEKELDFIASQAIQVLYFTEKNYPKRLSLCEDAPLLLYYKGNGDLNQSRVINIVGTRNATDYGKELCSRLVEDLAAYDVLVVSGLAYGIDYAAHKACLKYKIPTVGVLGHGLDRIYPQAHRLTAENMCNHGGLLSEFPSATTPDRENFPKRNRIIAGLCDASVVVEASIKGGALITAEIADSYNRDVFAFPGRIGDVFSEGCNYLIRNNKAMLITGTQDLIFAMGWERKQQEQAPMQLTFPIDLPAPELLVYEHLKAKGHCGIDDLSLQINMPMSVLAMNLLNLEMRGLIKCWPGKTYGLMN